MELNQYYKNKINKLSTYLCNPLIKKDEVLKYCIKIIKIYMN